MPAKSGHFSIQESAAGGLSYKVKITRISACLPLDLIAFRAPPYITAIGAGIPAPVLAVVMAAPVLSDPSDPLKDSYCNHLPVCCDVATDLFNFNIWDQPFRIKYQLIMILVRSFRLRLLHYIAGPVIQINIILIILVCSCFDRYY